MANSRYGYVRQFEQPDSILPNTWIVIRVDGRAFHRFSTTYDFAKPNDARALRLMNVAARGVFRDVQDVVVAYGQSDEFSFVLPPSSTLFDRRASKLTSTIVSTFTAYYILHWPTFFPSTPLTSPRGPVSFETSPPNGEPPEERHAAGEGSSDADAREDLDIGVLRPVPTFDARAVAHPTMQNLRDYLSWRQVDCHINNLFNTTFWALVDKGGMSQREAEVELQGTYASDKNEILFSRFGINYNNEPAMFRKGSVVYRDMRAPVSASVAKDSMAIEADTTAKDDANGPGMDGDAGKKPDPTSKTQREKEKKRRAKARVVVEHVDLIEDAFWDGRPWLFGG